MLLRHGDECHIVAADVNINISTTIVTNVIIIVVLFIIASKMNSTQIILCILFGPFTSPATMARNYITQSSPGLRFRPFLCIHNHYLNIKKHTVTTEEEGYGEKAKSTACKDMMRPISDHITIFTAIWHCNDNKLLKIYYDKKNKTN